MKGKLRIDMLAVESFETTPPAASGGGTVHANNSHPNTCNIAHCPTLALTCDFTCPGDETCAYSCGGTCMVGECTGEP
jgi:hypothetical protein